MTRTRVVTGLTLVIALLFFSIGLMYSGASATAVALVLCLVSIGIIVQAPVPKIGVFLILLFSFTASWDNASIGGIKPRQIFVVLGLVMLIAGAAMDDRRKIPWWIHVYAFSAIGVTVLQWLFPISPGYINTRYATSAAGQSLGTRPAALPSLLSTLFNTYAIPLAIILVCLYLPRSLRWIITAYVSGAALSCFAAYLGYEGYPILLKPLAAPSPPGVRALGYTSHPLHLATSAVMAIGLACWLSVQPQIFTKWVGRLSLVGLLLGVYASGSRGGTGAVVFALALSAFALPTVRSRVHIVLASVGMFVAGVVAFMPGLGLGILQTTRIYNGLTNAVSDTGRGQILDQSLVDFYHSPIYGIGLRYIAEAHILYAGILASGGIILSLAYIAFNVGSLRCAVQGMAVDRQLAAALLVTIVSSLAYWSVADDFGVASVQIVYGCIVGLLFCRTAVPIPGSGHVPAQSNAWQES